MSQTQNNKNILVTGGAGFIGSNLVEHLLEKHPEYTIINLDALTYAGNLENLEKVSKHPRYTFLKGNICNRELVEDIFKKHDIRGVFHLAAESHVDNSIDDPGVFMHTNVIGTFNLVNAAYHHWMKGPNELREGYEDCRFHHTSTDEVYGSLGETGLFTETTAYSPNPPYAASKASSDLIVKSYHHTYGLNITMSNCSNNYGPHQHAEKLIPTIIRKAIAGQPIPIYGDGKNIRDWLHVRDHCSALDLIFHTGISGNTYNIGCHNEQNNNTIAKLICSILDEINSEGAPHDRLISYVKDRAGHDRRYAIDSTKIETQLGWKANYKFSDGLFSTVEWYFEKLTTSSPAIKKAA